MQEQNQTQKRVLACYQTKGPKPATELAVNLGLDRATVSGWIRGWERAPQGTQEAPERLKPPIRLPMARTASMPPPVPRQPLERIRPIEPKTVTPREKLLPPATSADRVANWKANHIPMDRDEVKNCEFCNKPYLLPCGTKDKADQCINYQYECKRLKIEACNQVKAKADNKAPKHIVRGRT